MRRAWILLLAACSQVGTVEPIVGKVDEGRELIGTSPPPLAGVSWTDGRAHPLTEDRGKVVLVRWWTDTCPLCVNSAQALQALARRYGDDLVIRAVYHNKVAGRDVTLAETRAMADRVGYPWLVGHDPEWGTLRQWWLTDRHRSFTSVSFLVGKQGKIRAIHTGGEFHSRDQVPASACVSGDPDACHREYEAIRQAIAVLVAES